MNLALFERGNDCLMRSVWVGSGICLVKENREKSLYNTPFAGSVKGISTHDHVKAPPNPEWD
jgi:hypothetical protein